MDWHALFDPFPPHPQIVHFPLALLIASVVCDALGRWRRSEALHQAGFYTLGLGVLGALAAVTSGLLSQEAAEQSPATAALLGTHRLLAFILLALFGGLLLYRLLGREQILRSRPRAYLALAGLGLVLVTATGWYGGELVYRYGVGVGGQTAGAESVRVASAPAAHDHSMPDGGPAQSAPATPSAAGVTGEEAARPVSGDRVTIDNFSFTPQTLTVAAGTAVTWVNHDDIPHTVTSVEKKFRSSALDTDDVFTYQFTTPGTYTYFCSIHPKMTGTVIVQ